MRITRGFLVAVAAVALSLAAPSAHAYGVLTHLALVGAAWDDTIVPARGR